MNALTSQEHAAHWALENRSTKYIFVTCMLDAQWAMQVLEPQRNKLQLPTKSRPYFRYESPLIDALWAGYIALKYEAERCAKEARIRGQLLCAFEGTTVLDMGVAA